MKLLIVAVVVAIGYLGDCQGGAVEEAFNVTLAIFSGVPDPQWLITPKSANYQKIKKLLRDAKSSRAKFLPEQIPSKLGYKGFLVHEENKEKPSLIVGPKTKQLQEELLKSCPTKRLRRIREKLVRSLKRVVSAIIKAGKVLPVSLKKVRERAEKRYPPVFEGASYYWNHPSVQPHNNCYNYGNDKATNTFAQPGRGSGRMYSSITNYEIEQASKRDGLVRVEPGPGGSIPRISSTSDWHLVALVVDPGVDFHWYRLDSNGRWSHKPGSTPITNRDGDGNLIYDPRLAANAGIDYKFVCFMKTNKNTVNIR